MSAGTITHVAGAVVRFTEPDLVTVRQRCAWCGALLLEYPQLPFPLVEDSRPTWELYTLVRVDGPNIESLQIGDLAPCLPDLPEDSCFKLDHAVTQ